MNHPGIVSFIWGVADLIRDTFKRGKYQDVILPLTVLRRLDCVLGPTKEQVLKRGSDLKGKVGNLDPQLRQASGYAFYNTSRYTFESILQDSANVAANLRSYINGFSENMREVLDKFDFDRTITRLDEAGLLFLVLERFGSVDLHPDTIDNFTMGTIFEELIRKFNEALNENPGEHFTPRDVIHLMVGLMIAPDRDDLSKKGVVRTVYDPCCGTGGMLTITSDEIREFNPNADIHLYGQEVNPETYAVCKSDLFLKTETGRDADNIAFGSSLSSDGHVGKDFDYLITNPPYGKDWKMDAEAVEAEHERGFSGRFGAGLPRKSDGQLLFLQHMVSHMKELENGGSRVCIIMNGSPLFTGGAGSGESETRRWLMEEDLAEAIIALPGQLFYNTGIQTYIWVVTNCKAAERAGKVQLIDASGEDFWTPMRKSLGDKRREMPKEQIARILATRAGFEESGFSKVFKTTDFGYRRVTVDRPLKLNFRATEERIERLRGESAFQKLAVSKKKDPNVRAREVQEGREEQKRILDLLESLPDTLYTSRDEFQGALKRAAKTSEVKLSAAILKAILSALSDRDDGADVCRDEDGNPEPDKELRDTERVPLGESIEDYFEREVAPHVPDAWINQDIVDHQDAGIGKVGYEINFNRYFYEHRPPRPLEEIEADIRSVGREIIKLLAEVTGGPDDEVGA